MKRKHWGYIRRILFAFLFLFSCSPVIVPYAQVIVNIVCRTVVGLIFASTAVLNKVIHLPNAYSSPDELAEQYRRQQQERELAIQQVVGPSQTFQDVVSNVQQDVRATPSLPICVDSPSPAQEGWNLAFKHTPIFADALQRDLTHPMQQSLFTTARRAAISDGYTEASPFDQLIAREQQYEQRKYEIANEQECEHQIKLAEDTKYATEYNIKKNIAQTLIEQLVSGSEADRLSMTNQLFYRYQNDLAGHDRFALNEVLNELKSTYIGWNGLPREQISVKSKEHAGKKFEQFKLRLERSPKERIYICPEKFHVSSDDVTAGFVLGFIEFCERSKPVDAFNWLNVVTKADKDLIPFHQERKRCIAQHQSLFNSIYTAYTSEWEKVYTSDGFVKIGKHDPRLMQLTKSQCAKICSNAKEREKFNALLDIRHQRLTQLKNTLGISSLANKKQAALCNKILYGTIDREMVNATTLQHIDYIVDQVTPETLKFFFNQNGLCKLHADHTAVSGAPILYKVDTSGHRDILKRLNYLAALDAPKLHQPSIDRLHEILKKTSVSNENDAQKQIQLFDGLFPFVAMPGLTHEQREQKVAEIEQKFSSPKQTVDPQTITEVATGGPLMPEDPEKEKKKKDEKTEQINIQDYDPQIENLDKLQRAYELFKNTPGAMGDGPLGRVLTYGTKKAIQQRAGRLGIARGGMYELKKALDLIDQGEKIIEFSAKRGGIEFDIITEKFWAECKNIDWAQTNINDFQSKIRSRARKAMDFEKPFRFYSGQTIPESVKQWLIEKGITFFEG